jgi:formate hydrogenlyase subunit 4
MKYVAPILQGLVFIFAAPVVAGMMRRLRARAQLRAGPHILQPYHDLWKLLRKSSFRSQDAAWVFRASPYLSFSCCGVLGFGIPLFGPPLLRLDFITLIYTLGLAVFFSALAGASLGTPLGGLGSNRMMFLRTLVEPAFFLVALALMLKWRTINIISIVESQQERHSYLTYLAPDNLLLALAMCLITLVEAHRLPISNPETNLELTMTFRGTLLEYSGPHLALAEWSESLKLLLLLTLIANVFFPLYLPGTGSFGAMAIAFVIYAGKVMLLAFILTIWELSSIGLRFGAAPEANARAAFLALLAIAYTLTANYLSGGPQ